MKRIITATVQNRSGVLNRVTGMLQRRQFNISSISVGETETPGISKMTLVVEVSDDQKAEQLTKQLNKQIDVIKVSDITDKSIVARELALIKVASSPQLSNEIQGLITPFRATVIDISKDSITIQVTGKPEKIDALIALLKPYGIKELSKTGVTAFLRGHQPQPAHIAEINQFTV
ncbi:MAG TPA: acetolactate synthase small subunit [Candidatus Pseudogracilibacillus intestinigallinarum]|uniref:Acetolactate synthase small subunit n=1 Tax=Candidatus Pseudogracilibacillus intestinigallinarum TaxID=2838742 RepID=A0A9D1PN45_9BACI|nr:acetolactate synthase small subunit [Candidatus Pseudogracilibacillus intestinigallinarum]